MDSSGHGWRFVLPERYLSPDVGFPDLLDDFWMLTYRDQDFLVAVHMDLWAEWISRLRHELCEVGRLSDATFRVLYEDRARRIRKDKRDRWPIDQHLARYLHLDAEFHCTLVLQTREAYIEIRTLGLYHKVQRSAELEASRLRAQPGSSPIVPQEPTPATTEPAESRCTARASSGTLVTAKRGRG